MVVGADRTMSCVICRQSIDLHKRSEYVKLTEKGCAGINKANHDRNLDMPDIVFSENDDILVHKICRSKHTNPKSIKSAQKSQSSQLPMAKRNLRSEESVFDFKTHCLFCGVFVDQSLAQKKPNKASHKYSHVMTLGFQENVLTYCHSRQDDWATQVKSRLSAVNDLPAEESIYHHTCKDLFLKGKDFPGFLSVGEATSSSKRRKVGRPRSSSKVTALQCALEYLEANDDGTITLQELHQHMVVSSGLDEEDVYTTTQLKRELVKHYDSKVTITTVRQLPNVVTLTSNVKSIIQEAHDRARELNELSDMDKLIESVGKYIRTEIKSMEHHDNKYPKIADMGSLDGNFRYLPHSLQLLLGSIIKTKNAKLKMAAIGQSIMQSTCPRAFLPPLQVGLSVTLEHKYGHRDLVDMINRLGFCSSYAEANKYRTNSAAVQGVDLPDEVTRSFLQYQADNVDHASRTIDGHGSVHVMGQMGTFTPAINSTRQIPRLNVDMEVVRRLAQVKLVEQKDPKAVQSKILYKRVAIFQHDIFNDNLDIMWTVSFHLPQPQPLWSGYMQMLHHNLPHPGRSSDIFLPMIDLTPSDPSCVRSALEYIVDHASRYNTTPVITFDQQLWWIAYMVIEAQPRASPLHQIILILGGFHTEMSFLGSIGCLMAGSGLKEVMSQVYAEGSVDHMLSGKAIARAVRAHLLVDSALNTIATAQMLAIPVPLVLNEDPTFFEPVEDSSVSIPEVVESDIDLHEDIPDKMDDCEDFDEWAASTPEQSSAEILAAVDNLVKQVAEDSLSLDEALSSDSITHLKEASAQWHESLSEHRTGKLWIMYMELVAILRTFVKAGRTGNWMLYLQALQQMLPYLASSGHHNYTKSLVLYLNKMEKLQDTHPHVYTKFVDGFFVLRRSNKYWAGIYSDLYIEQVLMRNVKSVGGLTRGRGFEQSTRLIWLLSTPACAEANRAMKEVTGLQDTIDEEVHKDRSAARMTRDIKDVQTILHYFCERKPFARDSKDLRSLSSGVIADKPVNVDTAESVGQAIVQSMYGKSVAEYKFCKKDRVITLAHSTYLTVDGECLEIDPRQLFQRLVVAGTGTVDTKSLFTYELSSYPTALFDTSLLMRLPDKASLQTGLVKKVPLCAVSHCPDDVVYVLDGGALLQRLPWPNQTTYTNLSSLYVQYVQDHYTYAVVVFDGYSHGPSTKDEAHQRRAPDHNIGAEVNFKPEMRLTMKKKAFLANLKNKQKFLYFIGSELEKAGIEVRHSDGDADYDIVSTACTMAERRSVTVVGDDTDLLVLLLHYLSACHHTIFLQTPSKVINIRTLQDHLDTHLVASLLFLHAATGCDTTSRPYGIGKVMAIGKCDELKEHAIAFMKPLQGHYHINRHGQAALEVLYSCKPGNSLDFERAARFRSKVASRSVYLPPESLPPTCDAARYHSYRVYHQVQAWLGNNLDPKCWGWTLQTGQSAGLIPLKMQRDPAPANLLKLIKCNCHGKCDKNTCSCCKNGLLCSLACGHCKGMTCTNSAVNTDAEPQDDEADC